MTVRKSLALIDKECQSLEDDLFNPSIADKDGLLRAIDANTADWLTKMDNISRILLWLKVEADYVDKHAKYLKEKRDQMRERDQLIRQATIESMTKRNENHLKFGSTGTTMYWQPLDIDVEIISKDDIPIQFFELVPEHYELNLPKLKKHINDTGEVVPGVKVIKNRKSLTIRS